MLNEICRNIEEKVYSKYRHFKDAFIRWPACQPSKLRLSAHRMDRGRTGVIDKEQLRSSLVRFGVIKADQSRCHTLEALLDRCDPAASGMVR